MSEHLSNYYSVDRGGVSVSVTWTDGQAASLRDALRIAAAIVNDARLREEAVAPKVVPVQVGADGRLISWAQESTAEAGARITRQAMRDHPFEAADGSPYCEYWTGGHVPGTAPDGAVVTFGAQCGYPANLHPASQPAEEKPCGSDEHHGAHCWDSGDDLSGVVEYFCPGDPAPGAAPGPAPEVDDGEWVRREP